MTKKFAVIDLEATGMTSASDRIIEIGIILLELGAEGLAITDSFESLIRPDQKVPKNVLALTGINERELDVAPRFVDIAETIDLLTRDCTIVAHGVQGDYELLRSHFEMLGKSFLRKTLCSANMARENDPTIGAYDLLSLCRLYDIDLPKQHRALTDAVACAKLFTRIYLPKKKQFSALEELTYKVVQRFKFLSIKELNQNIQSPVLVFLYRDNKIVAIEPFRAGGESLIKGLLKLESDQFDRLSLKAYPHFLIALIDSIALRKRFRPAISLIESSKQSTQKYPQEDFELVLETRFGPHISVVFRGGKLHSIIKGESERRVKETGPLREAIQTYLATSKNAKVRPYQLRSLKKLA